jgi:hypothetical protein
MDRMKALPLYLGNGSALPLPLAGEGWGGGARPERRRLVERIPPPAALWRAIALPGASTSPASGRGAAEFAE